MPPTVTERLERWKSVSTGKDHAYRKWLKSPPPFAGLPLSRKCTRSRPYIFSFPMGRLGQRPLNVNSTLLVWSLLVPAVDYSPFPRTFAFFRPSQSMVLVRMGQPPQSSDPLPFNCKVSISPKPFPLGVVFLALEKPQRWACSPPLSSSLYCEFSSL